MGTLLKYTILLTSAYLLCLGPSLSIETRRILFLIFIPSVFIVVHDFFRKWYPAQHIVGLPLRLLDKCQIAFYPNKFVIRKKNQKFKLFTEKLIDVRVISSAQEITTFSADLENVIAGALVGMSLVNRKKGRAHPQKHNMLIVIYERDCKNQALVLYLRRRHVSKINRLIRPYQRQCDKIQREVTL